MAISGGHGVQFQVEVSASLTEMANVREVQFPEEDNEITDVTAHDSPSGYSERLPTGRVLTSEFTVLVTWDDAETTHQEVRTHHSDKTILNLALISPDSQETLTFAGFVRKLARSSPQDGSYDMEITIAPSGAVVLT